MAITLIRSNPALFRAMGIPSDEALAFTDPLNTEAGGDGFIADEETGYVDLSLQLDDYDSGKFAESPATAFLERLLDPLNRIARATPTDIVEELEREARLSPFVLAPFAVMPPVPAAIFAGAEIAAMSAASDTPANDDPPPVTDPSPAPSPATSLPSEYRAWLEAVIAEKLQLTFTNKSMQAAIKRLLGDYLGIRDREASEKMPPSEPQAIVELVMLAASERTGRRRSELHPFEKQLALLISALTRHMARLFFDDARLDPMASAHFPGYDAMAKASKDTITPEHFMAIIERNLPKGGPKKVAIIGPSKVEIDLVFEKWPKAQIVLIDSNKEKMAQIAAHYSLDPRVTAYAGLVSGGELPKDIHADLVISNFALPLEFAWSLGTEGIVAPGGVVLIQCQEFGNAPLEASVSGHKITEGFELLADQFGKPLFRTNISDRAYPIGVRAVALKAQPEGLGFEEALMTILYRTRYRARPDASKIREMLVDEAGKKDESVDTEDKALRFWDQEAKARGYESLETYLMMRFGYMSATALPSQMRRHMIELADTTDTDSLAFREWDYVADRKDAIAAELEAEGKVAAEKIDKLAKIMAGIEFYNPEWKDKLEPDDFVDDILEPAPERAQELMDLSIVAAKDDFPELVVSPDMPAQDMIKRLTAFFTDYRDAERRYDSAALNNRHCCESAQRVVSILRGKGFKARMLSTFKENIGHWMAVVELGGREYVIDTDHHQFGYDDLMIVPIDDLSKFDISVSAIDIFFDTNALHNAQIHAEQLAIREYMRMLGLLPASGTSIPPIAGGAPAAGELGSKQQVEIAKIVQKDASKNMGVKGYDPRWAGKLVAEREEGITVDFGEGQERNLFIPHELLFSDLGKAISAMFEKYYQTDGRDECALGVITVDEEPRYVVVRGGFAVTPVGRPIMHTHPKGAYVLPTHGDTQKKYISKGETQYIYSVTNDGDEILTSYTKLNDEDVLLADIAQFKDDSKITKRSIIAADSKERHVIPLGEILSLISRAKHGVTTAEFKWGGAVIMLTVRMGEDGTVEGIDMRGGNGGTFNIPKESVRYLRPYDTPQSTDATSGSEIKPPSDAEMSELESALDIIYAAPDVAKRIYDNDRNLYSKVELLALARINPVEVRDLLYNLWANTIIDIRGAATEEDAKAYFRELDEQNVLNNPTQRTKALLDALDISPWLMMAFGTKPGFTEDIAKVRIGYKLYEKYTAEMKDTYVARADSGRAPEVGDGERTTTAADTLATHVQSSEHGMRYFSQLDRFLSKNQLKPEDGESIYRGFYVRAGERVYSPKQMSTNIFKVNSDVRRLLAEAYQIQSRQGEKVEIRKNRLRDVLIQVGYPHPMGIRRIYIHTTLKGRLPVTNDLVSFAVRAGVSLAIKLIHRKRYDTPDSIIIYTELPFVEILLTFIAGLKKDAPEAFIDSEPLTGSAASGIKGVSLNRGNDSPGTVQAVAVQYMLFELQESGRTWNSLTQEEKMHLYTKWFFLMGRNPLDPSQELVLSDRGVLWLHASLRTGGFSMALLRDGEFRAKYDNFLEKCRKTGVDPNDLNPQSQRSFMQDPEGIRVLSARILPQRRIIISKGERKELPLSEEGRRELEMVIAEPQNGGPMIAHGGMGIKLFSAILVDRRSGATRVKMFYLSKVEEVVEKADAEGCDLFLVVPENMADKAAEKAVNHVVLTEDQYVNFNYNVGDGTLTVDVLSRPYSEAILVTHDSTNPDGTNKSLRRR